ncbi:hypothetical protein IJH74_01150 [Candidatus Saccharibacteria bacterium]|nr:hypothetical protein [Candidatus Saccharibacteria bacterium]
MTNLRVYAADREAEELAAVALRVHVARRIHEQVVRVLVAIHRSTPGGAARIKELVAIRVDTASLNHLIALDDFVVFRYSLRRYRKQASCIFYARAVVISITT